MLQASFDTLSLSLHHSSQLLEQKTSEANARLQGGEGYIKGADLSVISRHFESYSTFHVTFFLAHQDKDPISWLYGPK